jgi:hypothetical protein
MSDAENWIPINAIFDEGIGPNSDGIDNTPGGMARRALLLEGLTSGPAQPANRRTVSP